MTLFNRWAISDEGLIVSKRAWRKGPHRASVRRIPRLEGLEDRCLLAVTEFPIPTSGGDIYDNLESITAGPDGNLWFTESDANKIGRITTAGVVTQFPLPAGNTPTSITTGPDGNLWFTEAGYGKIGRITTTGVITEFPLTPGSYIYSWNESITAGPDGNIWFTEQSAGGVNEIGRITTAGVVTGDFPLPADSALPRTSRRGPTATSGSPRRRAPIRSGGSPPPASSPGSSR